MKKIVVFLAFVTAIALANAFFEWTVPMLPEIVVKALAWFMPGFCVGYLILRRRALRLVAASHGEASAAALNKRL